MLHEMNGPLERLFEVAESAPTKHKTLVAEVYHRLRSDIIQGRLKPGARLRAEHLKLEYQVGAATLREALALLVTDALVVSIEQRGFRVAPMSIADFADITETRALMEAHAVRLSILGGDDEWEANLSAAFHRLSRAEERRDTDEENNRYWDECNKKFHEALVANCKSRWTQHFLSILYRQSERYRLLVRTNSPPDRDVHQEHVSIFEAAINREEEKAAALIDQHIRLSLDIYITVNN